MQELRVVLSSSAVDAHGDVMTIEGLQCFVDHINRGWVPVGIEHDPRIPPQGRVYSAELKLRDDGIYVVEGVIHQFEPGDAEIVDLTNREMPVRKVTEGEFEVAFDRTFYSDEQMENVRAISDYLGIEPHEEVKKAVDPVSVLTLVAGVAGASFGKAFFSKLGEESATGLINAVKKAFASKSKRDDGDNLLSLIFCSEFEGHQVEFQILLTNPTDKVIDSLFEQAIPQLGEVARQNIKAGQDLRRIVYDFDGETLSIRFAVRKDAYPLYPKFDNSGGEEEC